MQCIAKRHRQAQEIAQVLTLQQTNSTPGMKSNVEVETPGIKVKYATEQAPSPEAKTSRKNRNRSRNTKQSQDTMNGHKPMKQMTSHTETSNGCDETDAARAGNPTITKQKDNMEIQQTENPELAQNKVTDIENNRAANKNTGEGDRSTGEQHRTPGSPSEDKDANENTGEGDNTEGEQHRVPESPSEDKDVSPHPEKQLIWTMLQAVNARRKCSCEKCYKCQASQSFKHRTANNIRRKVKEIEWPPEIQQLVLVFGHKQETIVGGKVTAQGHLAKVTLGACRVQFEHEVQQENETTVLEDASGLIYGVQQQNQDCNFENMVKIKLVTDSDKVTVVKHKTDLQDRIIDCTNHNELNWVMQGTEWSHYRGKKFGCDKETQLSSWLNKMEELTDEIEDLYGVQLLWQRDKNKHMSMGELLCPVINNITPEIRVCVEDFYKQKQFVATDMSLTGGDGVVECCVVDGRTIPRVWTQPRVQKNTGSGPSILRFLMWNPENLAQRLDLDKAVSKGKQTRMNSPPLRSVRGEWAHKIQVVDPEFIIYNEASLGGADSKKRNSARRIIREAEEFHSQLDFELIVGFEGRGHTSHGGAIAVKQWVVVTDVQYGFNGGRDEQGRVVMIKVATDEREFNGKQVDGV